MTTETLLLIGVAVVAIAAALAAFAIAWRRSSADWRSSVSSETKAADKRTALDLPPVPAEEEASEPEPTPEVVESEPEPEADHEPVPVAVATETRLVEVSPEEAGVTRRQFFNRAIGATFGAYGAFLGLSFLAFLWPRVSGGFGADVNVGSAADLLDQAINDDGSVTPVFVSEARAYVVPSPDQLSEQFEGQGVAAGGVMALYQRCVHLGCRVPWCDTSQGFECPCHGSKYNSVGEWFDGPAPRNLDRFAIETNDAGELIVRTSLIIQTPRALLKSVQYPVGPSCIAAAGAEE